MKLISTFNLFQSTIDLPVLKKIEIEENGLSDIKKIMLESNYNKLIVYVETPFEEGSLEVKIHFSILTKEYVIADEGKFTFERINNRLQKTQGIILQSSIRNCLLKQNTIL